jgi:hypothetical protein
MMERNDNGHLTFYYHIMAFVSFDRRCAFS